MIKTFKAALAATLLTGAMAIASPANAVVYIQFEDGLASPAAGYAVINTFDGTTGISGSGFQILTPPANGSGAPPAFSNPAGTAYLSVLAGGSATVTIPTAFAYQFDWGSIDTYNTLVVDWVDANGNAFSVPVVPGGIFSATVATGDQLLPNTNGRFTVFGDAGEIFSQVTFQSSQNSFEIDNLAVIAVPEPATWAMLICGFGLVGAAVRRRTNSSVAFA